MENVLKSLNEKGWCTLTIHYLGRGQLQQGDYAFEASLHYMVTSSQLKLVSENQRRLKDGPLAWNAQGPGLYLSTAGQPNWPHLRRPAGAYLVHMYKQVFLCSRNLKTYYI